MMRTVSEILRAVRPRSPRLSLGLPRRPALGAATARRRSRAAGRRALTAGQRRCFKAGKKREAREEYLAAFRLKQSHDVAGNLGNVELALGMRRDAAEHLSFAIRALRAESGTTPEQIEKAKQKLAEAKRQVGTVSVSVSVPGAEVLVDGVSVGRAPLEGELFVEPGTRHVSPARLAGHEDAKQTIEAGKGTEQAVALTLVPTVQAAAAGECPGGAGAPVVVASVTPPCRRHAEPAGPTRRS